MVTVSNHLFKIIDGDNIQNFQQTMFSTYARVANFYDVSDEFTRQLANNMSFLQNSHVGIKVLSEHKYYWVSKMWENK